MTRKDFLCIANVGSNDSIIFKLPPLSYHKYQYMKITLLAALAAPLFVSTDNNESKVVLLRGAGAVIASDSEDTMSSFSIPEFLAQPEYCFKK